MQSQNTNMQTQNINMHTQKMSILEKPLDQNSPFNSHHMNSATVTPQGISTVKFQSIGNPVQNPHDITPKSMLN